VRKLGPEEKRKRIVPAKVPPSEQAEHLKKSIRVRGETQIDFRRDVRR
jgi:hypothetical protein